MPVPARVALNATLLDYSGGYRSAGVHRYLAGLAGALPEQGVPLTAFTADPAARAHLPDVDVRLAPRWTRRRALRIAWEQTVLPARARRAGAALIHGGAYAVPLWPLLPRIVTIHDLSFFRMPETLSRLQSAYLRAATRHSVRVADAVIAVSPFTGRELTNLLGIEGSRLHVVPNGIDAGFGVPPPPAARAARARLGLPDTYILALGTLQPRKNLATLLAAYARLVARTNVPDLVIAGGAGWGDVPLEDLVKRLALAGRVHQCGFVPAADLAAVYAGATVLAYPSLYEGFGLPVLEAMACGVPVLVSEGSGLQDLAGPAGMALPPTDPDAWAGALEVLAGDPEQARRLGELGRARAAGYSWSRTARETAAVYRSVLEQGAPVRAGVHA